MVVASPSVEWRLLTAGDIDPTTNDDGESRYTNYNKRAMGPMARMLTSRNAFLALSLFTRAQYFILNLLLRSRRVEYYTYLLGAWKGCKGATKFQQQYFRSSQPLGNKSWLPMSGSLHNHCADGAQPQRHVYRGLVEALAEDGEVQDGVCGGREGCCRCCCRCSCRRERECLGMDEGLS